MTPGEQPNRPDTHFGLIPPGGQAETTTYTSTRRRMVWAAFLVVVILGVAVVIVLPKLVAAPESAATAMQTDATTLSVQTALPPIPVQDASAVRGTAEMALQDFLQTRARLELANAPMWGEPEWSLALNSAEKGNRLFGQRQFAMAMVSYTGAQNILLSLESESRLRLDRALVSAQQSLEGNDSGSATGFFEIALAIDPHSEIAGNGLQRARVRPEVLQLMATGNQAVSLNKLSVARSAYHEAVALDKAYGPASAALQQVSEQINELAFQDAMSRAMGALEANQVGIAEQALRQASALKPREQVVGDVQKQMESLRQDLWLADHRRQAAGREHAEDWPGAVDIYRTVLAAVPQAAFAKQGLEFAQDRARLHRQLDHFLDEPTRIYSEQPLANAEILLESAGMPPLEETLLADKIHRLQSLITEAQTPLTVTLQSDGMTSVLIYHVGRLGQFTRHQLELRPGTYTAIGSRAGYRDVRQTFSVRPGVDLPALDIRCEESV